MVAADVRRRVLLRELAQMSASLRRRLRLGGISLRGAGPRLTMAGKLARDYECEPWPAFTLPENHPPITRGLLSSRVGQPRLPGQRAASLSPRPSGARAGGWRGLPFSDDSRSPRNAGGGSQFLLPGTPGEIPFVVSRRVQAALRRSTRIGGAIAAALSTIGNRPPDLEGISMR